MKETKDFSTRVAGPPAIIDLVDPFSLRIAVLAGPSAACIEFVRSGVDGSRGTVLVDLKLTAMSYPSRIPKSLTGKYFAALRPLWAQPTDQRSCEEI